MEKQIFFDTTERVFCENGLSEFWKDKTKDKFFDLCNIMLEQNKVMNLSAIRDEQGVICRHFADSLTVAKHIPEGAKILDVGSGGGMPTLPLAIARPDIKITALDATAKKMAYVRSTAEKLGLANVSTISARAEELGNIPEHREKYDVVCARAVAELRILAEWCVPFAKKGGLFIAMKGKNGGTELHDAKNAVKTLLLHMEKDDEFTLFDLSSADEADAKRHIFVFRKTAATPKQYPRRNAQIQKKPL
ncbi:MAG: 16S rRNA (guanine(527)-N(7))-methyltransferase RsmG [Clostridia bacterium]|nr:16S rRNA (guanine(527)-N(7))-methyltransferase RsmG [Clostridia bacterium]MBQ9746451.1 16S rRNA (guanine(527)-N(7))-methyltransferase RsmG [Clostridia bacterium]